MELVIEDLAARRAGRKVLTGVSARVAAGRALVVTGPNGAGKSTLLRVLAGFLPPAEGDARLEGSVTASLVDGPGGFQERVAYTGHLDAVKPALGVAENLALWAGLHGTARSRIEAALAHFGLAALAERAAGACSAGQKRRLGLARLMVIDRPVWLMDEPTASLDAASAATVAALVRRHCADGGIAVIATHQDLGLENTVALPLGATAVTDRPPTVEVEPQDDPFLAGEW
ncbi:MAG: heme ABC exporter ATP-binding protein CcmA [Pseudomonadota bacterium]